MNTRPKSKLIQWIEWLCGQEIEPTAYVNISSMEFPDTGLGQSQLNELLLSCGLDRVDEAFFLYVFEKPDIPDLDLFIEKVEAYRVKAAIKYGNFKFSFKHLKNKNRDFILSEFDQLHPVSPESYCCRHTPLVELQHIEPENTYYLGYLIEREIREKKDSGQISEQDFNALQNKIDSMREKGKFNNSVYMDYDHMDVYVATSMREKLDFWNVYQFTQQVFNSKIIAPLNLRYFDPTQAYCPNRIDKGLVEGLMLKRAQCTIYMAGELESLGKDSELATTLAQGKPVIAYVPNFKSFKQFMEGYITPVREALYPGENPIEVAMKFLKIYYPQGAWEDDKVQDWITNKKEPAFEEIINLIFEKAKSYYDQRSDSLKNFHPLGLQMNLLTGVANGVLVARDVGECVDLLRGVLLNTLEFVIEDIEGVVVLREKNTKSIFRVVTKDKHLTNSFWNFYLLQ